MRFFRNKKYPPIPVETSRWMEQSLEWLTQEFGSEKFNTVQTFHPLKNNFAGLYADPEKGPYECLQMVCGKMDMPADQIKLTFFEDQLTDLQGNLVFPYRNLMHDNEAIATGLRAAGKEEGIFSICLDRSLIHSPGKMIARMAHEVAQIKIVGEGRITENDEYLNDIVTVFFGFGILGANHAKIFSGGIDEWEYAQKGYFTQQEWGYLLALYAIKRNEPPSFFTKHLSPYLIPDFKKAFSFIQSQPSRK